MPADAPLSTALRFTRLGSGARLAWARSGCAGAPVLVRAAHWMTHVEHDLRSPIWRPWLERLGRRLEVVRYDERGCGMSSADDVGPGLEAAVEELAAVIEARGAPRVALLGQSGAGAPAIAYAARHPERVSHLVLLGAYLRGIDHAAASAETRAFHEAQLTLIEHGWGRHHPAVHQFFTTTMIPDAPAELHAALNEQQRLSCDGARAAAILRARARLDVSALAPQVRCPTLVLHAAGDAMVPMERGVELAASIPGARFETLASRNHIPVAGEAAFEHFCERVADFVAEAPPLPPLSPRERALLALVGQGLDNLQIAAHLGLAEKTVRNGLSALYARLRVEGRAQAIVLARRQGLSGTDAAG